MRCPRLEPDCAMDIFAQVPAFIVEKMKGKAEEMNFWTQEEFETFVAAVKDKPISYMAFKTLYWTGCRLGELLALTLDDFNPDEKTLRINKSYQRIKGRDVITEPKTEKSKRIITLPDFLVEEMKDYVDKLYGMMAKDRLFTVTKSFLEHEMIRGVELSGVKKIRLHDDRVIIGASRKKPSKTKGLQMI